MKVAILTFHNSPNNAGAVLQAWALQRTIEKLGHNASIVDYHRLKGDLVPWWSFKTLRGLFYTFKRFPLEMMRLGKCRRFRKRNLNLVGTQYGGRVSYKDSDAFIVGSDQVFNPTNNESNPDFLLDFAPDGKKRIAYGASFGTDKFLKEYVQMLKDLLPRFYALSVRETTGVETVKRIADIDAQVVLDPTLLLDGSEYRHLFVNELKHIPEDPYVFLYIIGSHSEARRIAEEKAIEIGARNVIVMTNKRAEWHLPQVGMFRRIHVFTPADFLSYISNAAYVVTNSFHGTAFSIIFNRRFEVLKNGTSGDDRMATLLATAESGGLKGLRSKSINFLKASLS